MPKLRNQHIIPKVYLKQFSIGDNAHVYCIDYEDKYHPFPQKRGIGDKRFTKKNFYNDYRLSDPLEIETFLGNTVEQSFPKIIETITLEKQLNEELKNIIMEWIYYSCFRSDKQRKNYERIAQHAYRIETKLKKEDYNEDFANKISKSMARDMQLNAFTDKRQKEEIMAMYKKSISSKSWRILKANPNYPFFTNDNPGFSPNRDDRFRNEKPFHYNPEVNESSWIYFVLSPIYCLEFLPKEILKQENNDIIYVEANVQQTNLVNWGVHETRGRYIISNKEELLKQNIILKPKTRNE